MSNHKSVLYIGIEPTLVDLSSMADLNADKLASGIQAEIGRLVAHGYDADWCPVDLGTTAEATVANALARKNYDVVVVGAGIRSGPLYFLLFEKLINAVHRGAPHARMCFNTRPTDTLEAVQRWV